LAVPAEPSAGPTRTREARRRTRTLLHTPWDYPVAAPAFLAWLAAVSEHCLLVNDLACVRWNHDKGYLLDLAERGIPIPAPALYEDGRLVRRGPRGLPRAGQVVVKPAVGAGRCGAHLRPAPRAGVLDFSRACLEALPIRPLYARVDLIETRDGPLLMELEVIEPDLYLRLQPGSTWPWPRPCSTSRPGPRLAGAPAGLAPSARGAGPPRPPASRRGS
jgi:hypothetical protein